MKKALLAVALALTATGAAFAGLPEFDSALRANILKEVMSAGSWQSGCHLASNGLGAITRVEFVDENTVKLTTHHFLDSGCTRDAGMTSSRTSLLSADGKNPNRFRLGNEDLLVAGKNFIALRSEATTVVMTAEGTQK